MSIQVPVDPTNPGQFFACCGLLELADRLWPGAEGWFAGQEFSIACDGDIQQILAAAKATKFAGAETEEDEDDEDDEDTDEDEENSEIQPLLIESPVQLRLDWWADKSIKTWAGSMNVRLIAIAMCNAINQERHDPFNQSQVVFDPPTPAPVTGSKQKQRKPKKREPFYFDARRGPNAHSRDVGFSPNDLKMKTTAFPVVEFFCLLGLQRGRPAPSTRPRVFHYFTWTKPLAVSLLPPVVSGLVPGIRGLGYRFENRFRSGQKKLKAYYPSVLLGDTYE
jgi:CRISPR-associated protein Csb3